MADIYFQKQHWIGGEYWQLCGIRNVEPQKRARLNLECQEYRAVSGDIGDSSERVERALGKLRDSMKADGHQLHFEEARKPEETMNARTIIDEVIDPKRILRQLRPRNVVKLRLRRKSSTEEWVVRVWVDGRYSEDMTYYTDDKQDALSTMTAMMSHFRSQGCSVI